MNTHWFDTWTRALSSRRTLLGRLTAGGLGLGVSLLTPVDSDARCVRLGKICKTTRGRQRCCGGATCRGRKCRCTGGRSACGRSCCSKAATCQDKRCRACDVCPNGCRFTSLVAAVNAAVPGGTIRVCPGSFPGSVTIAKNLTIVGAGAHRTTLDGLGAFRVLTVNAGSTVVLRDLTVTQGVITDNGAGILNSGNLTLERVTVSNCRGNDGGGIYSNGTLTVRQSLITGNTANRGAGLFITASTATMEASHVVGNRANDWGGGWYITASTATLGNGTTVTGNTAVNQTGGGIFSFLGSTVTIAADSQVIGNTPNNCAPTGAVPACVG